MPGALNPKAGGRLTVFLRDTSWATPPPLPPALVNVVVPTAVVAAAPAPPGAKELLSSRETPASPYLVRNKYVKID
jgi:hypothetical protein